MLEPGLRDPVHSDELVEGLDFTTKTEREQKAAELAAKRDHDGDFCLISEANDNAVELCGLCKVLKEELLPETVKLMREYAQVFNDTNWPHERMEDGQTPYAYVQAYGSHIVEDAMTYTGAEHCAGFQYLRCFYDLRKNESLFCPECTLYDQALWRLQPLELLRWINRTKYPRGFKDHLTDREQEVQRRYGGTNDRLKR